MEPHQAVKLPFEPVDVLIGAIPRALDVLSTVIESLPWPVKLLLAIFVYARITRGNGKTRRS